MNETPDITGFQHPKEGWYSIISEGVYPNAKSKVIQVIDAKSIASQSATFNREFQSDPHHAGMLIDIDHLKHDPNHDTAAYGWLTATRVNGDSLQGKIRWTGIGQRAVDNGEFRFFSTEYDPSGMEVVRNGNPKTVRPIRLAGLSLTNVPNIRGGPPITNREPTEPNNMNDTISPNPGQARILAEQLMTASGRSFESCWDTVRNSRPELFGLPSREELEQAQRDQVEQWQATQVANRSRSAPAHPIHGDGLTATQRHYFGGQVVRSMVQLGSRTPAVVNRAPLNKPGIGLLVQAYRQELGIATFGEAWDLARRERPEIFS